MNMDRIQFLGAFHHQEISSNAVLHIEEGVIIRNFSSVEVASGATLRLGKRVFFNTGCVIRCLEEISIGKDSMFGDGVKIYDANHDYSNYHIEKLSLNTAAIHIGKNCWIGANCVILKGVTIGDNVIIGAGCVIHKDIPSNSIVHGTSNLIIKERRQASHHVFTLTASDTLEQLTYLLEQLPDVDFHIAAPTSVSPYLTSFKSYPNVQLYTNVHHEDIIDDLLDRADIYLDINHWHEVADIINRAKVRQKPILSFDTVSHTGSGYSSQYPEEMLRAIKDILKKKEVK